MGVVVDGTKVVARAVVVHRVLLGKEVNGKLVIAMEGTKAGVWGNKWSLAYSMAGLL